MRLILLTAFLLPVTLLAVRAAPPSTIRVLDQHTESRFPDDLSFLVRVQSDAGDVVGATLNLRPGWSAPMRRLPAEPFSRGREVELVAVWRTTSETMPPFVALEYHWEIVLADGATYATSPVQTEYTDPTHDWQRLEDENVIVFWHDRPAEFGAALFTAAQDGYAHVARVTGVTTEQPIRVVIYNRQSDFCAFYAPRACQSWIGGVSLYNLGVTAQWGTNLDWFIYDVIPHELAHVFYGGEIFKNTWMSIPTWFNEGIAVYNERHEHTREWALVQQAGERGELIPFRLMSARGGSVADDRVAAWYAQAYSLVAYLVDLYGEDALGEIILTMAGNVSFEDALRQVTGLDLVAFEMGYREWIGFPIDEVPTPIALPTLEVTPFTLPTRAGQPAATRTPRPPATAVAEVTPTPTLAPAPTEPAPESDPPRSPGLCPSPLALPLAGLMGWWLGKRRMTDD